MFAHMVEIFLRLQIRQETETLAFQQETNQNKLRKCVKYCTVAVN